MQLLKNYHQEPRKGHDTPTPTWLLKDLLGSLFTIYAVGVQQAGLGLARQINTLSTPTHPKNSPVTWLLPLKMPHDPALTSVSGKVVPTDT